MKIYLFSQAEKSNSKHDQLWACNCSATDKAIIQGLCKNFKKSATLQDLIWTEILQSLVSGQPQNTCDVNEL